MMNIKIYVILTLISLLGSISCVFSQRRNKISDNTEIAQQYLNDGVNYYQASKFDYAYESFSKALNYRPGDTTITYYAGLSAINAKFYKEGIQCYEALIKTNFSANNQIYLDLSRLYTMEGDTARAIVIASEGASKFNDSNLATQEIELSLMSGKQEEVITKISEQARKNPNNKLFPYYLGIAYSTIGESAKAEEAYMTALKIDPNFADASTNIGGIILNNGINLFNQANQLPQNQQKEYEAIVKLAEGELDRAFPYLIKSSMLDPKSIIALENLKTYYIIKRNSIKVRDISKRISNITSEPPAKDEGKDIEIITAKTVPSNNFTASGSGFIISSSGYVVTNSHVISNAKYIEIYVFIDNEKFSFIGNVVADDQTNDLAIIKITDPKFTSLNIPSIKARNNPIEVGENVFAMGYPRITLMGEEIKLTNGIVNSKSGYKNNLNIFQISAPVQYGSSGGPVFDDKGDLIGVVNSGIPDAQNVGYAIKTSYLKSLIEMLPNDINYVGTNNLEKLKLTEKAKILKRSIVLIKVVENE